MNLNQGVKDLGTRSIARSGGRMQSVLVVAEVAPALLLIGAGLMMKGFLRRLDVDPGFDPESVATMSIGLPQTR